jgi:hypothetical protein
MIERGYSQQMQDGIPKIRKSSFTGKKTENNITCAMIRQYIKLPSTEWYAQCCAKVGTGINPVSPTRLVCFFF